MATADSDSDSVTKRCTAEPIQVPTASVNPAAAPAAAAAAATMARMAGRESSFAATESSHPYPYPSPSPNPQNNYGTGGGEYADAGAGAGSGSGSGSGVPLATILPQPQTAQQFSQRSPVPGVADDLIDDSGTESGEELRSLNPQLLAEVRGALSKLETALPNLDAARRTSLIPLVNKLQSCLKVTETPLPQPPPLTSSLSPRPCVLSPGHGHGPGPGPATATGNESTIASISSKNRKTRHTIGVSREELNDARKWLVVAQNVADHLDVITPSASASASPPSPTPPPRPSLRLPSSLSQPSKAPIKYESPLNSSGKVYKPVKFTPTPTPTPPIYAGCCDNEAFDVDEKHATTFTRQHCASELLSGVGVDDTKFAKRDDGEKRSFAKTGTTTTTTTTTTKKSLEDETTANSNSNYKSKSKSKSESESEYFSGEHSDLSSSEEETRATAAADTDAFATASNETWKKPTPSRFQRKTNKNKRMKRANTIDVVPNPNRGLVVDRVTAPGADAVPCEWWFSSDETATAATTATTTDRKRTAKIAPIATVDLPLVAKPTPPKLQLKTENDKKFAAFLQHTKQDESQSHSKTSAAYNPSAAGGIQWSNRFSNIKTTFESAKTSACSPPLSPRPLSLTPTSASVKSSSTSRSEPVRQAAAAAATTTTQSVVVMFPSAPAATTALPRQSFTHAQKSPFKPVTKVAPFHTRSLPSASSSAVQTGVKQQQRQQQQQQQQQQHA